MASSLVNSRKHLKRTDSRKSHSWWWDSHISPKNSKWLAENLEEMDQSVKRMLKLIEEDGDSFAKKADMYYQKRPELTAHVEEFYRMYRSLAERYDHITTELRKNVVTSDLQSQGSGISDIGSEPTSTWPSPDQRPRRRKSDHRAAGFDFFLGSGGSTSDLCDKEGDEISSSLDSESESDDSSVNNYSGLQRNSVDSESRRKIMELEIELRDAKEKLRMQEVDNADGSSRGSKFGNPEELLARNRIVGYEEELTAAKEKIRLSKEEVARLRKELQKYGYSEFSNGSQADLVSLDKDVKRREEAEQGLEAKQGSNIHEMVVESEVGVFDSDDKIQALMEELRITKERLRDSEKEIISLRHKPESNESESIRQLQYQLELAQKDGAIWKVKLNAEKREVSKLQERIARYKTNLSDREHEIRELKVAIADAEQSFSLGNLQLQDKVSKLVEEKTMLEEKLKEWERKGHSLEEEIRRGEAEKTELQGLHKTMENALKSEIEQLKADITERGDRAEDLNKSLDDLKYKYYMLISERDELNAKILKLTAEVNSRDDGIGEMEKHLHQLHVEHAELIAATEGACKLAEQLRLRVKELEEEVERQTSTISEAAEEKREAIRQLCFSLEHYRNGYNRLRQAFVGNKRPAILAS